MKKAHFQYSNPRRLLSCLLKEMANKDIQNTNKEIKSIIRKKKQKIKELYNSSSHQVIQQPIIIQKQHPSFSQITPLSKDQQFISEKIRSNSLKPNRAFSKQPNMKAGSFGQIKKWRISQDRSVTNGKFEQYSRIVDQQSGIIKKAKLEKVLEGYTTDHTKRKYSRMRKTYFQKLMPDKYNFYKKSINRSIGMDSTSILKKSRSRILSPSDVNVIDSRKGTCLAEETEQIRHTIELPELHSQRSREKSRDRSLEKMRPTGQRGRLKTVIFQKNLDSLS